MNLDTGEEYFIFLDECGDHSLKSIDPNFPVFVLALIICTKQNYNKTICPAIRKFKIEHCGSVDLVLHSYDIRKHQKGFSFLNDHVKKEGFMDQLSDLMKNLPYTLIAVAIDKKKHKARYSFPDNPYLISLKFAMERLYKFFAGVTVGKIRIGAETRGKNEDRELKAAFFDILTEGTEYISSEQFKELNIGLEFVKKSKNVIGNQLADLAAYPIARYVINPEKPNPAIKSLERKFFVSGYGYAKGTGLKIFP